MCRARPARTAYQTGNNPALRAGPETVWQSYGPPGRMSATPRSGFTSITPTEAGFPSVHRRWPAAIKARVKYRQSGHITDIMATCLEAAGVEYPKSFKGQALLPMEGKSLQPIFQGKEREVRPIFWEHEGNRAVRVGEMEAGVPASK